MVKQIAVTAGACETTTAWPLESFETMCKLTIEVAELGTVLLESMKSESLSCQTYTEVARHVIGMLGHQWLSCTCNSQQDTDTQE